MSNFRRCLQPLLSLLFPLNCLRLRLSPDASTAALSARLGNQSQLLAHLQSPEDLAVAAVTQLQHLPVEVLLPLAVTLRHSLHLSRAALRNPRRAIHSAIDHSSPGAANSVYFDFRLTKDHEAEIDLGVEVVMAPRAPINDWLRSLQRSRYTIRAVIAEDGWTGNNLLPPEQRAGLLLRPTLQSATSLALLALLLAVAWSIPLWKHNTATSDFEVQAAALRPDAEAAEALMLTLKQRIDSFEQIVTERQSMRPIVDILLELTNLHSDGSWVRSLKISGREIVIRGETRDAAVLVTRMEQSPMFDGTELRGPAVKIPGSFYETYDIRTRLAERHPQ